MQKNKNKFSLRKAIHVFLALTMFSFYTVPNNVYAGNLPEGITDVIGSADVSVNGSEMSVITNDAKYWGNADSFDIGSGYALNSMGPNSSAAMLYNVTGPSGSDISGVWNSNCNQFLINPTSGSEDYIDTFSAETLVNILSNATSDDVQKLIDAFDPETLVNTLSNDTSGAVQDFIDTFSAEELIDTFGPELVANILPILRNDASSTVPNIAKRKAAGAIRDAISNIVPSIPTVAILPNDESDIISNAPEIRTKPVQGLSDLVINKVGIVKASSVVIRDGKIVLVSGSESYIGQ